MENVLPPSYNRKKRKKRLTTAVCTCVLIKNIVSQKFPLTLCLYAMSSSAYITTKANVSISKWTVLLLAITSETLLIIFYFELFR